MLETGRRAAISTSELGLYSDHSDRYSRSRYSAITRKFAIATMVLAAVILVGILWYDFTSVSSMNSKDNQESKHMYILQNALKKPSNFTKKFVSNISSDANKTETVYIQDRSDNENYENFLPYGETENYKTSEAEYRSQNLNNFKLRKRVLKSVESGEPSAEGKQLFDNHAVGYRIRQRYTYPDSDEDGESSEVNRPTPFHWELKTPYPTPFKRQKYPQLSQYRYPHSSRNIQDIIKYLTNDAEAPNKGIKFTGVYVNPKKYDMIPEVGEMMSNSDRSEEDESSPYSLSLNEDPFYQYKPKHLADVNLLATSNVRFSPTGVHRYNPYYDAYPRPISYNKQQSSIDSQYENPQSYPSNYGKKRKPKPFSVMLDIYPITDIMEQNKKNSRPKQIPTDDYELRRPIQFNRGPKFSVPLPQTMANQAAMDEEERQQMVFHLNLYPRRKNKLSRHDIIHRSESMAPEDRQQFVDKIWSPLETIAKHLAVERSKQAENEEISSIAATRYQETVLENEKEKTNSQRVNDFSASNSNDSEENVSVPPNHKSSLEEDYASTEKYEYDAQKIVGTTTESECEDCNTTIIIEETKIHENETVDSMKDMDTIEGFKRFQDGVSKTNLNVTHFK